jgi:hypothetical protein
VHTQNTLRVWRRDHNLPDFVKEVTLDLENELGLVYGYNEEGIYNLIVNKWRGCKLP